MSKHIHAEAMLQYAQDALETDRPWEQWEVRQFFKDSGSIFMEDGEIVLRVT